MQDIAQKGGEEADVPIDLGITSVPLVRGTDRPSVRVYREQLESVQTILRSRGFSSGTTSRLGQYLKKLNAFAEHRSDETIGPALHAAFETRQIGAIFQELASELSDPQIKHLLSGHFSPDTESGSASTAGRNYQFELYIAAVCKRAGFEVDLVEPDIRVRGLETDLGIAVKRIQSSKMLTARIKDANRQITARDLPGIVVADLTPLFNPENRFLRVFSAHRAREILGVRVERFVKRNEESLTELAGPSTLAYLFHAAMPVIWVGHEMGSFVSLIGLGVKGKETPEARMARDFATVLGEALVDPRQPRPEGA